MRFGGLFLGGLALLLEFYGMSCWTIQQPNLKGRRSSSDRERKIHRRVLTSAHVLHKTFNLVISRNCFAENSKEPKYV